MCTKEIIESILKYSNEYNVPEKVAAKQFNINYKTLSYYKKKYGIKSNQIGKAKFSHIGKRNNKVNDYFFETPNELNCYWAGFIAADGCIHEKTGQNVLSICISNKDDKHLKIFKNNIDFSGNIITGNITKKYKDIEKTFGYSSISICSQKISDDLCKNFNIIPKKSLILLPPNITDEKLIDAFICGYIDGDGSVFLYNDKNRNIQKSLIISMLGTYDMMIWIKNRFTKILGKECGSICKKKENNTYSYTVGQCKFARILFEYFYKLNLPKLERKWSIEIHEYCINYQKRKPVCRRKGVNVFNLNGCFLKHFDTLLEASEYTNVSMGRISDLCKINDNNHMSNGFMFSRNHTIDAYIPLSSTNKKYLK